MSARAPKCYLAPIVERILKDRPNAYGLIACDGRLDPHHWVPQRLLKSRPWYDYDVDLLLADPRNISPICRKHHDLIERHAIKVPARDLPPEALDFARELGFEYHEDRAIFIPTTERTP